MRYQLTNGEEYQDRFSLEQIHNHQLPNNGSVLTKPTTKELTSSEAENPSR